MFKKGLDLVMNSMIGLGQAFLKFDGIGFDALVIGFVVMGLIQFKAKLDKQYRKHLH